MFLNFFGADFVASKSGHQHEKQPLLGPDVWSNETKEWNKSIFISAEYILFILDERFYTLLNSQWTSKKCVNNFFDFQVYYSWH